METRTHRAPGGAVLTMRPGPGAACAAPGPGYSPRSRKRRALDRLGAM